MSLCVRSAEGFKQLGYDVRKDAATGDGTVRGGRSRGRRGWTGLRCQRALLPLQGVRSRPLSQQPRGRGAAEKEDVTVLLEAATAPAGNANRSSRGDLAIEPTRRRATRSR